MPARESGGFREVRGATFGRRDADLIEAGSNEAGWLPRSMGIVVRQRLARRRGGARSLGPGERWSSILPEVNGASGGLRPFATAGGVPRAGPARKGPAAGEDDAVEAHRSLYTGGSHDVSHWNSAVADGTGRRRATASRGRASRRRIRGRRDRGRAREVAVSAVAVSQRSICWAKADRQSARLAARQVLARKPKYRMRWKRSGSVCRRKRRMNSSGASFMTLTAPSW